MAQVADAENAFFQALAEDIVSEYPDDVEAPSRKTLRDRFASTDPDQAAGVFWEAVHDLAIARGVKDDAVLLPVDEFEELLAPAAGAMANSFLAFLKAVCERPNRRFLVIGTMRSDYLDAYEQHPLALTAPLFDPWRLEPFPRERLAGVIVKPAMRRSSRQCR